MGERMSIPAALDGFRSPDRDLRLRATVFLRDEPDDRIVAALVNAMDDQDARIRDGVAYVSGARGEGYDVLVAHLRNDPSASVRYRCVRALSSDCCSLPIEAFIEALGDAEVNVVTTACIALARSGDRRANAPLRQLLRHRFWEVHLYACWAHIRRLKAVDAEVVATLEVLNRQPEAGPYNDDSRHSRELEREVGLPPNPEDFTTDELLQAAKEALGGP